MTTTMKSLFKADNLEIVRRGVLKTKPAKESLVFGKTFTDYMMYAEWDSEGWGRPVIKPYGPLSLNPSASVFHYATECFEGLKAYKDLKNPDILRLFRPEINMNRFNKSAQRLSLPGIDESELLQCIKSLVRLESQWIPSGVGYSLYVRPVMIATNECIGISQPDRAALFVLCSPVGPYFKSTAGFTPVRLLAEDSVVRAWPGGTGQYKIGANYGPTILPQRHAMARNFNQILWLFGPEARITEVGSMNCFILLKQGTKQELVTPPLTDGTVLPGVTRDSILKLARTWAGDLIVSEREIRMEEFIDAHKNNRIIEAFGSGTAAIVAPISCINYRNVDYNIPLNPEDPSKQSGPLTERLFNHISKIQYGEIEHEWSVKF